MAVKRRNLLYRQGLKEKARENRKNMTGPEKMIWNRVLRKFKYRVTRQKPIGRYIVDFYCAKLKLVIEIDGESHYVKDGVKKDRERDRFLKSQGLTVMRFTNPEVMSNIEGVWEVLDRYECKTPSLPLCYIEMLALVVLKPYISYPLRGKGEVPKPPQSPFIKGGSSKTP